MIANQSMVGLFVFFELSNKEGEGVTTREAIVVDEAQPEDGAQPVHHAVSIIPRCSFSPFGASAVSPVPSSRCGWAAQTRGDLMAVSFVLRQFVGKLYFYR